MKLRKLAAAVGAIVALTVSACGSSSTTDEESPAGGTSGNDGNIRIGVAFYTKTIPMYAQMEEGILDEAEKLGVDVEVAYANNSAETQSNQINTFVTKGVDVILASPVDVQALEPAYRQARGAGIPVISVGNKINDEDEDAYIGPDLSVVAEETMDTVIEGMGGEGELLLITGPPQIAFVQAQKAGWERSLAKAPGINVVDTLVVPDMTTGAALDIATSGFTKYPNVTGVLSSQDDVALGAIQAAQSRGMDLDEIYFAGWNGAPNAIQALKDQTYDLSVSMRPVNWGRIALQTAVDFTQGKKPTEHHIQTPTLQITQDNVNTLTDEERA